MKSFYFGTIQAGGIKIIPNNQLMIKVVANHLITQDLVFLYEDNVFIVPDMEDELETITSLFKEIATIESI